MTRFWTVTSASPGHPMSRSTFTGITHGFMCLTPSQTFQVVERCSEPIVLAWLRYCESVCTSRTCGILADVIVYVPKLQPIGDRYVPSACRHRTPGPGVPLRLTRYDANPPPLPPSKWFQVPAFRPWKAGSGSIKLRGKHIAQCAAPDTVRAWEIS
jgi:hypothetical protein